MKNEMRIFENAEFGSVRTANINGIPYFIGKDVCEMFGDKNHNRSLGRIDSEDKTKVDLIDNLGRKQSVIAINESGLYALLFAMQPQKANNGGVSDAYPIEVQERIEKLHKFKRWVTSEILPTIRKTGGYVNNDDLFIDTYLPFADDTTKLLFKNTLNVINNQNKLISEQKNEIRRKSDVIQGFAEDIPNPTKRKILNEVVRYGGNYKERWNCLYKEFKAVYGIDVSARYKNYVEKGIKPKIVSKLDYVEKKLDMLDEIYGLAVKLYESDINKIKERYDILSERN